MNKPRYKMSYSKKQCDGCAIKKIAMCHMVKCMEEERTDNRDVIFIEIKGKDDE